MSEGQPRRGEAQDVPNKIHFSVFFPSEMRLSNMNKDTAPMPKGRTSQMSIRSIFWTMTPILAKATAMLSNIFPFQTSIYYSSR
jgi:hypothetical protein